MQTNCCVDCATSGIFQEIRATDAMCHTCRTVAPLVMESRDWGESRDAWIQRAFATFEEANQPPVEVMAEVVGMAPKKARCPHYATIQAFFKAAKESGLDTVTEAGKMRCRGAMGVYLGKRIASRSELTANDWENGITAVKAGLLFW